MKKTESKKKDCKNWGKAYERSCTLVPDSLTNKVMDAIGQGINIDIPGNGICFSIDVDKVIGITKIHQYREIIGMQELLDENNDREKSES